MARTWIGSDPLENTLLEAFSAADVRFSKLLQSEIHSHEEKLTDLFVATLVGKAVEAQEVIRSWGTAFAYEPWEVSVGCRDAPGWREKEYSADLAFLLSISAKERMERKKALLVQTKKINVEVSESAISFLDSWSVDFLQAERLSTITPFGYYFLYGPHYNRTCTRVIPVRSVIGILNAIGRRSRLPILHVLGASKPLAEFLVYDFIGCWIGDHSHKAIRIAEGEDNQAMAKYTIRIDITKR